jgi:sugar phosphate isomerase/epimerase
MRFVYFTKTLRELDLKGLTAFCKEVGLDGLDLAVRPGYPVTPENATKELPEAQGRLKSDGLSIGLATAPTDANDPEAAPLRALFEACAAAAVPAVKIGYFPYRGGFDDALKAARRRLEGFARLAERTGVKACLHTHSGDYLGNNAASLRLLLEGLDPHHVGAFLDTGHTAVNGGPFRLEADIIRPWLSLLAIKDMLWEKAGDQWRYRVVPVGDGIVKWPDVAAAVRQAKFNGTVSLHAEYEAKDRDERLRLAKRELAELKRLLG